MQGSTTNRASSLSAILVAPDRTLAFDFGEACAKDATFEILMDLKSYPSEQTLEIRVRQLQPDVALVDVASDPIAACQIIGYLARLDSGPSVVALDARSDSDSILRSLRAGASEYLYAPFDPANTAEAVVRLLRLRRSDPGGERELGAVCAFSSVKPGSGASTLATQCAFALRRSGARRVLLFDLDLMGGTIGFYLKLNRTFSALDALEGADRLNASSWTSRIASANGVDILPAPLAPWAENLEMTRIQGVIDFARTMYDWVICDLPVIFQRTSLMTVPQADRAFLVSTAELPSLNLARRSVIMLEQLGFPKERFNVVLNRLNRRDGITRGDMEKLFNCPVQASVPNDYFSLHRVVTLGQPLAADCELGKSIENLAARIASAAATGRTAPALDK